MDCTDFILLPSILMFYDKTERKMELKGDCYEGVYARR